MRSRNCINDAVRGQPMSARHARDLWSDWLPLERYLRIFVLLLSRASNDGGVRAQALRHDPFNWVSEN
jgi:hypothetical protein